MRRLLRIFRIIGSVIGVITTITAVVLVAGTTRGYFRPVTVLTGSMRPTMPEGSILIQVPLARDHVEIGDVITYRMPVEDRHIVTHRVVEIDRTGGDVVVVTKGDANGAPDTWRAALRGDTWKTVYAVPYAGYVEQFLRSPLARQVGMPIVTLLLAVLWLRDIWRKKPESVDVSSDETTRGTAFDQSSSADAALDPRGEEPRVLVSSSGSESRFSERATSLRRAHDHPNGVSDDPHLR